MCWVHLNQFTPSLVCGKTEEMQTEQQDPVQSMILNGKKQYTGLQGYKGNLYLKVHVGQKGTDKLLLYF